MAKTAMPMWLRLKGWLTAALDLKADKAGDTLTGATVGAISLALLGTRTIAVPAAISTWNALDVQASTLTLAAGGVAPTALSLATFAAPTISGDTAGLVIDKAATLAISGAPIAGANTTLTNPFALHVQSGASSFEGHLYAGRMTGAGRVTAVQVAGGLGVTLGVYNGPPVKAGLSRDNTDATAFVYYNGTTGDTVLDAVYAGAKLHFDIGGTPRVNINHSTIVAAADATWNAVDFLANTCTLTGAVTPVTALSFFNVAAPTITSASAITVASAATVYIAGPPVAAGSTTITAPYAIWSDAGNNRFDGTVSINVGGAATGGTKLDVNGNVYLRGGTVFVDALQDYTGSGLNCANVSMFKSVNNFVIGAAAAGATAAKCLALSNSATAPSASANLAHLYSADHGGVADSAALALYQEIATATCGDQTVDRAIPITVNGVALWVMARSAAPV